MSIETTTRDNCKHAWDHGTRTEGTLGGYVFTCRLCGVQKPGWRTYLPKCVPDSKVRMSKKQRRRNKLLESAISFAKEIKRGQDEKQNSNI